MACFNAAYGLCSVTDPRGFIGVSNDEEGCAVITLEKNMVIRCRLSDQKQLNSWSTMLAKLSSKVVCSSDGNYTGVFDNVYIKQWNRFESNLEKVKKHKLKSEIHEIIFHRKVDFPKPKMVVLFKNGSCAELTYVLENHRESRVGMLHPDESIKTGEFILDNGNDYLIIVAKFQNKYFLCYSIKIEDNTYIADPKSLKKIKLRRQGATLLGYCVFEGERGTFLYTYWSDGFLYSLPLPIQSEKEEVGKFVGTIDAISRKSELIMMPVSQSQLAIYAGDSSDEGAVLLIYNVKFGMIQAQTNYKMFNKPPKMWLIEKNLLIVMGQRLMCVPFKLQTETLSALVGSRALSNVTSEISAVVPTAVWDNEAKNVKEEEQFDNCPLKIKEQLSVLSCEGWSESGMCQMILSELIEKKDIKSIYWCMKNFIDIPEDLLVQLLSLALQEPESSFKNVSSSTTSDSKSHFLFVLLTIPLNKFNLLGNIRNYLKFEESLLFFNCVCSSELLLNNEETDFNILNWTTAIFDVFYQQLILSRDESVLKTIQLLKDKIESQILDLNEMLKLIPILLKLRNGKEIGKNRPVHSNSYYVERFTLYK